MARINLTKAASKSEAGISLINFLLSLIEDGEISDSEIKQLNTWLNDSEFPSDIPAFEYLRALAKSILQDGKVSPEERLELFLAVKRVLPKDHRDSNQEKLDSIQKKCEDALAVEYAKRERIANRATTRQRDFIRDLGGDHTRDLSISEASRYIDQLLANQKPGPTPRQLMVLRFWKKLELKNQPSEVISDWMDRWYSDDPDRKTAWELWKSENGDDGSRSSRSVEKVAIGIGYQYLKKVKGAKSSNTGCLIMILIAVVLFFLALTSEG